MALFLRLKLLLCHGLDLGLRFHEFLVILCKLVLDLLELALASLQFRFSSVCVRLCLLEVLNQLVLSIDEAELGLLLFVNRLFLQRGVLLLKTGDLLV